MKELFSLQTTSEMLILEWLEDMKQCLSQVSE